MTRRFDLTIIGAGPGGYSTALRAAELGMTVALVERDGTLGGTCLNRGCIPSKALITATRAIETVHAGERMGVVASIDEIDFGRLREFRDGTVDTMVQGLRSLVAFRGITVYRGEARLEPDRTVRVAPCRGHDQVRLFAEDGGFTDVAPEVVIESTDVVVATGSRPRQIPDIPFHGALIDSDQALALNTFPHSAVIIGSGAVALEFASMWNAAGSDVTLLIRKNNVLSTSDRRAALALNRELKRRGIAIVKGTRVTGVDTGDNLGATVHYQDEDGQEHAVMAEIALGAVGRTPNTDADWFAAAGLPVGEDGMVETDAYGRTVLDHVWALGDITRGRALAHRAFAQGLVIAERIAGLDPEPVDERAVPNVVFSSPEFATVGLTLQEAREEGGYVDVRETILPVMANARMVMDATGGSFSIVTGRPAQGGERIVLGAHIVAPDASDLIAEAQQLVADRVPLHKAASVIHPHPTFSEMLGEALLKADGRPLHIR